MDLKYKTVLFDFDGTVMDSGPGIFRCARETVRELGYRMPDEAALRKLIGPPLKLSFQNMFELSDQQADRMVEVYRRHYRESNGMLEGFIYPGMEALLRRLNECGAVCAIASVKREVMVRETLLHFSMTHLFQAICGAPHGNRIANKKEIMQDCINRLGARPYNLLMVGDSGYDAAAAGELEIDFCAAMWGYGFDGIEDLKPYQCRYIAQDISALQRFLIGEP